MTSSTSNALSKRIASMHYCMFARMMGCAQVYLAEDASKEMGLQREDMIAFAYFLGSDYTEGVSGVGIVNAVEIIHAFPMNVNATASVVTRDLQSKKMLGYKRNNNRNNNNNNDDDGDDDDDDDDDDDGLSTEVHDVKGVAVMEEAPLHGLRKFKEWLHGFDFCLNSSTSLPEHNICDKEVSDYK